jgi:two-component system, sensor histidine kinase YesM
MQKINLSWKNSIFRRLLATFLLVMIPIYVLAVSIYYWGINTINNNILESLKVQNSFYLSNLEDEIKRIKKMQFDSVNDSDLNNLANASLLMDNIGRTFSIKRLQEHLTVINNSSMYIKSVGVHIPAVSMTIYSEGMPSGSISDIPEDEFNVLKVLPKDSEAGLIYWHDRIFLSSGNSIHEKNDTTVPPFIIEIELDKYEVSNILKQSNIYPESGTLLISNSNNLTIANISKSKIGGQMLPMLEKVRKKHGSGTTTIKINNERYLVVYTDSVYLNMSLIKYVPEAVIFSQLSKYRVLFILLSVAAVVIIVFYAFATYRFIHKPILRMVQSFKQVENGDLNVIIEHNHQDEFRYLYHRFNAMVENLKTLIEQVYKQKILMQKAELKQLQSQINPHFLYNSFYILQRMITIEDNLNAVRFAKQLGNYFKFITRSAADEVPLEKEVDHARVYSDIQVMRFAKRLSVEFEELPDNMKNIAVPRLILQPIIENSFEHGLKSTEKEGLLRVCFMNHKNKVQINVEDNGKDLSDEEIRKIACDIEDTENEKEVTGIINIHRRICLKFGQNSGLTVSRGETGGLKVTISIELQEGEKHVPFADC